MLKRERLPGGCENDSVGEESLIVNQRFCVTLSRYHHENRLADALEQTGNCKSTPTWRNSPYRVELGQGRGAPAN